MLVLGATGTIGRATVDQLVAQGHDVICFVRSRSLSVDRKLRTSLARSELRAIEFRDPLAITKELTAIGRIDAIISCIASRTGMPEDAWAIDYSVNASALSAALEHEIPQMILLSAICVQKPRLEFQKAKLAFENLLIDSGMEFSIVRPTAFFKSLSGQIDRLKRGKPFLLFGNGELTACKPISDTDLAKYLVLCLTSSELKKKVLPIGGPGSAITPKEQGEYLFQKLGKPPRFLHVPVGLFSAISGALSLFGFVSSPIAKEAELAKIGRYYATESMLVLDSDTNQYSEAATPSFGSETLFDYYDDLISGQISLDRGEHAIF